MFQIRAYKKLEPKGKQQIKSALKVGAPKLLRETRLKRLNLVALRLSDQEDEKRPKSGFYHALGNGGGGVGFLFGSCRPDAAPVSFVPAQRLRH